MPVMHDSITAKRVVNVGLVADSPNDNAEIILQKQLSDAAARAGGAHSFVFHADPVLMTPACSGLVDQLHATAGKGYDVLVTMLGIPNTSLYATSIHNMLSAWSASGAAQKGTPLVIVSSDPAAAKRAVDSWRGWQKLIQSLSGDTEQVKSLVQVNSEYLVAMSGDKALAFIDNALPKNIPITPTAKPTLQLEHPLIEEHVPALMKRGA